jgi:hypothetical protein
VRALVLIALAACTTFEDPALVVDLRIVAMTATPPEQVLDVDLEQTPQLGDLVAQLQAAFVCAHVADPARSRSLRWSMTACLPAVHENGEELGFCDPERPSVLLAEGLAEDPELVGGPLCAALVPDANLVAILLDQYEHDLFGGFAGLDYAVIFQVGGEDADPALDLVGVKKLRVAARIPAERTPNQNPFLAELQGSLNPFEGPPLRLGYCANGSALTVAPGTQLLVFPLETPGTRQEYFAPAVDLTFHMFTETITYEWLATAGAWTDYTTGGTTDPFGNEPLLGSTWVAPQTSTPLDVQLWAIQRD